MALTIIGFTIGIVIGVFLTCALVCIVTACKHADSLETRLLQAHNLVKTKS